MSGAALAVIIFITVLVVPLVIYALLQIRILWLGVWLVLKGAHNAAGLAVQRTRKEQ